MFAFLKNIFPKKETSETPRVKGNPAEEAMRQVVENLKRSDPMRALQLGGKELSQRTIALLQNERGVHLESCLTVLAAVAGYSCQASVREEFVKTGKMQEAGAFVIAEATNGKRYFFGDLLNKPLAEDKYSIWSLTAGAAEQIGCTKPPEVEEIFKHVAETVGSDAFGVPRLQEENKPHDSPENYLRKYWPILFPVIPPYCSKPSQWPIVCGLAIQEIILVSKGVMDPANAVRVVMESAIPMSKIQIDFEQKNPQ
jgi:hypothetical protein